MPPVEKRKKRIQLTKYLLRASWNHLSLFACLVTIVLNYADLHIDVQNKNTADTVNPS